jgi:putative inorganic carbon (HCO3(-)) transporter
VTAAALDVGVRDWTATARRPWAVGAGVAGVTVVGLLVGAPIGLVLGLVAAVAAVVMFARPDTATAIFVFAIYANLPVVASRFHGVPSFAASAFVLVLGLPLIHHVVLRRQPLVVTPTLPLLLLYLAALMLSAASSESTAAAAAPIGGFLVEGIALYLLVVNVVRSPELLRRATWAIVLAAALIASLSVFQELTKAYDNDLGGMTQVTGQGFKVGEGLDGKVLRPRLSGPIGEQNRYAQILLMAAPLALFRARGEADRRLRWFAGACGVVIVAGMFLTFSRGAAVALGGLVGVLLLLGYLRLRHVVLIVVLIVGTMLAVAPDYVVRLTSLTSVTPLSDDDAEADGAIKGRTTSNLAAWNTFVDHPVFGVGPGRYFRDFSQSAGNELNIRYLEHNRRAHNLYLETAADLGLLGLAALLGTFAVTLAQLERARRRWSVRRPELADLAAGYLLALVAYLATAVFLHLSYQRYLWMLLALSSAAVWVLKREEWYEAQQLPA